MRIPEPAIPKLWLLDANVLFSDWSRLLCSELATRAQARLFYTPLIEDEAFRNLVRLNRLSVEDAAHQRACLPAVLPATIDDSDVSAYLADVRCVDEKDRPIAAAALRQHHLTQDCVALLTWNIKDFPRKQLLRRGVVRYTPDELAIKCLALKGEPSFGLIRAVQSRVDRFAKEHPLNQPTDFQCKARPWPHSVPQWEDFLKRNRLVLLSKHYKRESAAAQPVQGAESV